MFCFFFLTAKRGFFFALRVLVLILILVKVDVMLVYCGFLVSSCFLLLQLLLATRSCSGNVGHAITINDSRPIFQNKIFPNLPHCPVHAARSLSRSHARIYPCMHQPRRDVGPENGKVTLAAVETRGGETKAEQGDNADRNIDNAR